MVGCTLKTCLRVADTACNRSRIATRPVGTKAQLGSEAPKFSLSAEVVSNLSSGTLHSFASWPNPSVPTFGAGVYTVWHRDGRFIYVGMSGRGMTAETKRRNTPRGMYTRLQSHASGCRSGDQFCVYVADRLVLPTLSPDDITGIASGRHSMDPSYGNTFTRTLATGSQCFQVEPRPMRPKRQSRAAPGSMADHSSIQRGQCDAIIRDFIRKRMRMSRRRLGRHAEPGGAAVLARPAGHWSLPSVERLSFTPQPKQPRNGADYDCRADRQNDICVLDQCSAPPCHVRRGRAVPQPPPPGSELGRW
jgi:hypothetical protein